MKKLFSVLPVLALILALAPTAHADSRKKAKSAPAAEPAHHDSDERSGAVPGEPDTDGCGLGWQVTDKKTIIGSITRGTTNGIVPPSFGMTSGTLGCSKHPFTKRDQAGAVYALSNYDTLRIEMAEGRGEVLEGFARTMGCNDTATFGQMTQKNYRSLLDGKTSPVMMFQNVKEQIRQNPVLASDCNT